MNITLQTKVAALLDAYPRLEQTLLEFSPAFAKLKNPVLRRTVAKVASLQQAAKIAGVSPALLVQTLRKAAGLSEIAIGDYNDGTDETTPPAWFNVSAITVHFDAVPIIESGQSPMQEIARLALELKPNEILQLSAPFKPVPIIDLLKSKGFKSWYDGKETYFTSGLN